MDKERFCVGINATIFDAMNVVERIRERGVIIVDDGKVCGVLTLGDIIKALVEGKNIYAKIDKTYNPNFFYLNDCDYEKAFKIFTERNISFIPIVDKDFHLKDVITPRDVLSKANNVRN